MTICIAALCDRGKSVVVAADRMMTAPFLTIEFDHPNAKIDVIGQRCVALSAGDVLAVTEVLSESSGISGAHIHSIDDPGTSQCFDRLGYHAIGSGHRHAILSLVTLQNSTLVDVHRAIFNVYFAKRQSEIAPGVGAGTDMIVITEEKMEAVDSTMLKALSDQFDQFTSLQSDSKMVENQAASVSQEDADNGHTDDNQ